MNPPMAGEPTIIGVTGYPGAGKDTFAQVLAHQFGLRGRNATIVSSGDLIRRYVKDHKLGDPSDRALLQKVAGEVMTKEGYDLWLKHALAGLAPSTNILLYPGLRHPDEVDFIHNRRGIAIGIDVPIQTRYFRSQARNRPGDDIDFETFKNNEEVERHGKGQQLEAVMKKVDLVIFNDGTLDQLISVAGDLVHQFPGPFEQNYYASAYSVDTPGNQSAES